MKITESHLRSIIRSELKLIREAGEEGNKPDNNPAATKGQLNYKEIAGKLKMEENELKMAIKGAKTADKSKAEQMAKFIQALVNADSGTTKQVGALFSKVEEKEPAA